MVLIGVSILVLSIPVGYILKRLTIEEIGPGRIYLQLVWTLSFILGLIFIFIPIQNKPYKYTIIFSLFFISIISFISWKKPYKKMRIITKEKK